MKIRYTLSLARPKTHLIGVRMEIRGHEDCPLRVALPAWIPGHYGIMDNARFVERLRATQGGERLAVEKLDKQTWEIACGPAQPVVVSYDLYAHTLSSSASWFGEDQCMINGGATFAYVVGHVGAPCELVIEDRPRAWRVATGLDRAGPDRYRAPSYDVLIDCPTKIGVFHDRTFRVAGKTHHVVVTDFGDTAERLPALTADIRKFVEWFAKMFRGLPYREYWFLFDLHPTKCSGGALEHLNSTHLTLPARLDTDDALDRDRITVVAAHEFFHLWNVKRMRPRPLGPFDYSKEQHTTDLWIAEGLTDYYCYYALVKCGVFTPKRYFTWVGRYVDRLNDMPGRAHMTVRESSWETWTGGYGKMRASAEVTNVANTFADYYTKGSLIGQVIDCEMRAATKGRKGLDEVFRRMMKRAGRPEGFPRGEFEDEVERVAGSGVRRLLEAYVGTTKPIAYARHFAKAGIEFSYGPVDAAYETSKGRRRILGAYGMELDDGGALLRVVNVDPGSPAEAAGIDKGDLLLSADGRRLTKDDWRRILTAKPSGEPVRVALFRHDELLSLRVTPRRDGRLAARFTLPAKPPASTRRVRDTWLLPRMEPFTTVPEAKT
jgi:predicted metalloprotease with PDZ domain